MKLRSGVTATLVFGLLHGLTPTAAPQAPPRTESKKAAATVTAAAKEQGTPEESADLS